MALSLPGFGTPQNAEAATYTFAQTDWSGGVDTTNFPNHTDNRTDWTKFYSTSSPMVASNGALTLATSSVSSTWTETSSTDFAAGTVSGASLVGSGTDGGVALCTYDHAGANWTPTNGDAYDLDGSSGIAIAGTHCNIATFTAPSGTVSVYAYNGTNYGNLTIYATNATITGTLSGNGAGYTAGNGPGKQTASHGGAGHGGEGGQTLGYNNGGISYDSLSNPADFGSGGPTSNTTGGSGGGLIKIMVSNTITVNGTLSANGNGSAGGVNSPGGSGAGGTVYLSADTISGSGTITANGGSGGDALSGTHSAGGGGGGRIALYYSTLSLPTASITAYGGTTGTCCNNDPLFARITGGSGTIYLKPSAQASGDVIVDNNGSATSTTAFTTFDTSTTTLNSLLIQNGGVLSHKSNTTAATNILRITVASTTIASTGAINVTGRGYAGGGAYPANGNGPGAGGWAAGGGYGGAGGNYYNGSGGGVTYGSNTTPYHLGSGGGAGGLNINGGAGGGQVAIVTTGTLTINGAIYAKGGGGKVGNGEVGGGGGSGGSIYISSATLAGNGVISANGGAGGDTINNNGGGGGGGGRISVYYTTKTFTGGMSAALGIKGTGGTPSNGSAGTTYDAGAASYPGPVSFNASPDSRHDNFFASVIPIGKKIGRWGRAVKFAREISSKILAFVGIETAYAASGSATFVSQVYDTGFSSTPSSISWTGATSTTATLKFQIASSDSSGGTFTYVGPSNDANAYYTTSGTSVTSEHANKRYLRYKVFFDWTDTLASTTAPTLESVSIAYSNVQYSSSRTLVSSPFNTSASANIMSSLAWSETLPSGTDIRFQVRTAPDSSGSPGTYTSFVGPDGSTDSYFTAPAGSEAFPSTLRDGANDQWFQYQVILTSDGNNTPTLSDVTATYVVNAPPEFNTSFPDTGGTGAQASQVATTTDANWGKVEIMYSIRDTDTTSGTANPGKVTPSFQYDLGDGNGWQNITSSYLSDNALSLKDVDISTYVTYTAYWNAYSQTPNVATSSLRIKVTVNDAEGANNVASATSATTTLDTSPPVISVFRFDSTVNTITLMASDTPNNLQYRLSNNSNLSDDTVNTNAGSWQSVGAATISTTISWTPTGSTSPEKIYLQARDGYNSTSASLVTPAAPSGFALQDVSNTALSDWRLFSSWTTYSATTSAAFSKYEIYRSTDGIAFSLLDTNSSSAQNYYSNQNLSSTTAYYYKIVVLDTDGDRSDFSVALSDTPDGADPGSRDVTAPVISAVATSTVRSTSAIISFTTDELASSTVEYSTVAAGDYGLAGVSESYTTSHSVSLTSLTPNTAYQFRVKAGDPSGNIRTDSSASYLFTTASGPIISDATASSVSDTGATIQWNTTTASDSYVSYATSTATLASGDGTTVGTATLVSGNAPIQHTVTLSGLSGRTIYYYSVRSTDAEGNQTLDTNGASYYTFTTTYDQTPPVISNLATPVLTTDAAVVTWDTDELADSQVQSGATSGNLASSSSITAKLTISHSLTIASLTANTKYYYRVISKDANGNQATSSESSFTTAAEPTPVTTTRTIVVPISGGLGTGGGGTISQRTYDDTVTERDKYKKEAEELRAKIDTTPPEIASSSVSVTDITPFTATVHFTTSEPTFAFVAFGDDPTKRDRVMADKELQNEHAIKLSGLRFGTTYTYVIKAIDKGSNSIELEPRSFTTKFAAESIGDLTDLQKLDNLENFQDKLENLIDSITPSLVPPYIGNITVTDITESAALVSWTTNTKTFGSVFFAKTDEYMASSSNPYKGSISDTAEKGRTHSVRLANLEPLMEYHYAVTAFAIFGVNKQSTDATFTTKAPKVLPEVGAITTDGFTAFWKTTVPTSSIVEYKNLATGEIGKVGKEERTRTHTVALEHLAPNTNYEVKIYGFTADGNRIDAAQTLSVRTKLDSMPPAIMNLSVSNAFIPGRNDRLQTVVTWKTDEPASGSISYGEGGSVEAMMPFTKSESEKLSIDHAIILTSLKPATLYRFSVSARDAAGNDTKTSVKTILTPRESESVVGVIIKNFEETFGFLKNR